MCEPRFPGGAEYQLQSQVILVELSKAETKASWSGPLARMPRLLPEAGLDDGIGITETVLATVIVGSTATELWDREDDDVGVAVEMASVEAVVFVTTDGKPGC